VGVKSVFGERPDDEEMQEALRKARRRAADEERARQAALTHEQRLREALLNSLSEGPTPPKWPVLKPHPWQVEARKRLKQKRPNS